MTNKFLSRKFLLALGVMLTALGAALTGEQTWTQAIWQMVTAALAYIGVEGALDMKELWG